MRAMMIVIVGLALTMGPVDVWAAQTTVATEIEAKALRQMASAIPLGSRVKAQTNSGARVSGTLMSVTDEAVIIKKKTRMPEPAVTVPFAELARLELQTGEGMSAGKAIGIGLAAGAGAIVTLFAFFFALGAD
jgi:hypothetical protein